VKFRAPDSEKDASNYPEYPGVDPEFRQFLLLLYHVYEGEETLFFKDFGHYIAREAFRMRGLIPGTPDPKSIPSLARACLTKDWPLENKSSAEYKALRTCWKTARENESGLRERVLSGDQAMRDLESERLWKRGQEWREGWKKFKSEALEEPKGRHGSGSG
jgi:hypothetical protein